MGVPSAQDLESLRYSELQKLAKTVGLKANFKAEKLLKSLRQHFCYEPKGQNAEQDSESGQSSFTDEDDLNSSQEKDPIPEAYVTKRQRRRGNKADKISYIPKAELNANTVSMNEEALCEDKSIPQAKDTGKRNQKRSRPEDPDEQTAGQPNGTVTPGEKIPRYADHLKSVNSGGRTTTPNFKKLHEAHFKKMESIDTFVVRNKKRLQALSKSNTAVKTRNEKDVKLISSLTEKQAFTENFKGDESAVDHTVIKLTENDDLDGKGNSVKELTSSAVVPRPARRPSKAGETRIKATTPNLKKLKESHYEKMSLLDDYLERKKERLNAIQNSIEEVKMLAEKKIHLKQRSKKISTSNSKTGNGMWLFSPVPTKSRYSFACTPGSQRRSPRTSVNRSNLSFRNETMAFKPSILSSSKMNVRFSEATKDNEHKRSLTKTPARRSPYVDIDPDTPSDNLVKGNLLRKSFGKPGICASEKSKIGDYTPFKFEAGKVETPGTNKKTSFDIQASLAKPLGYEPHKGKLKPWGENENPASITKTAKPILSALKKEYKQPRLQTRESRRDKHVKDRKIKKDEMMGTRRGLIVK